MMLAKPQIVQYHLGCFRERMPVWNEVAPLDREKSVKDISCSIQGEEPHEEEVVTQALRKLEFKMEIAVEPRRKEPKERPATEPDAEDSMCIQPLVLRIGPVDKETRIDHQCEQREVEDRKSVV